MIQFQSHYKRIEKLIFRADGGRLFACGETATTTRRSIGIDWWDVGGKSAPAGGFAVGMYGYDFAVTPDGRVVHGRSTPANPYHKQLVARDPDGGADDVPLPVFFAFDSARVAICPTGTRLVVGCGWSVGQYTAFRLPLPAVPKAEWTAAMPTRGGYPSAVCAALDAEADGVHVRTAERPPRATGLVAQRRAMADGSAVGDPIRVPASTNRLRLAVGETRLLVAASATLHTYDLTDPTAKPLRVTTANRQHFTGLAVHPDGRRVLATGNDATVREYDAATLQELRAYAWKVGRLRSVAIAPDGLTAAAGSDTGKVVVWDLE